MRHPKPGPACKWKGQFDETQSFLRPPQCGKEFPQGLCPGLFSVRQIMMCAPRGRRSLSGIIVLSSYLNGTVLEGGVDVSSTLDIPIYRRQKLHRIKVTPWPGLWFLEARHPTRKSRSSDDTYIASPRFMLMPGFQIPSHPECPICRC